MVLLSVLDILLVIVGGAGMVYQAVCILISLFTKRLDSHKRRWTSGMRC